MSFKDASIVIIETCSHTIRAGRGLQELLQRPSIVWPARVALRHDPPPESHPPNDFHPTDIVNDVETPVAVDGGDGGDGINGVNGVNGVNGINGVDGYAGDSSDDGIGEADGTGEDASPMNVEQPPAPLTASSYLTGSQIDEAEAAGQELEYFWPFRDGGISDWIQAEAIWKRLLFTELGVRRKLNESPVVLSFTPSLSRSTYEAITQLFFERFNVPALCLVERPLAQILAVNTTTGIVVEIDQERSDVMPILDTILQHHVATTINVGAKDCEIYLAHLLKSSQSIRQTLSPVDSPLSSEELDAQLLELVRQLVRDGHIKAPGEGESQPAEDNDEGLTDVAAVLVAGKERQLIEAANKKKAVDRRGHAAADREKEEREREIAALDLITVTFRGKQVKLGKERHRFCEPLFEPTLMNDLRLAEKGQWGEEEMASKRFGLHEIINHSVMHLEGEKRKMLWEGLLVTGELSNVKGLPLAVQSRLATYMANEDTESMQPIATRLLKIPEYFAEYRDRGEGLAGFLGASIVAKVAFSDPAGRSYVSKIDYNSKGPPAVLTLSPSLF